MVFQLKSTVRNRGKGSKDLEEIEHRLENAVTDRIYSISRTLQALEEGWGEEFEQGVAYLANAGRALSQVREMKRHDVVQPQTAPRKVERLKHDDNLLRFSMSSRFLQECAKYLVGDEFGRERLNFVTGVITTDNVRVLSEMNKVKYAAQSRGGVEVDPTFSHRTMIGYEQSGIELLATFHSHPMYGAGGTSPSDTDLRNQDRFVRSGLNAVMGIVSMDGYFRLFATHKPIDVSLYGRGAEFVSRSEREVILKVEI